MKTRTTEEIVNNYNDCSMFSNREWILKTDLKDYVIKCLKEMEKQEIESENHQLCLNHRKSELLCMLAIFHIQLNDKEWR